MRISSTNDIHRQTSSQSRLGEEQVARVKRIQAALSEVDPSSFEKWVGDFEKDRDPEKELRLWEAIADAYQSYCSSHTIGINAKQDVLGILLVRSGTDDEAQAINHIHLSTLTARQARDVMRSFNGKAAPIEVERK